MWFRRSRKAKKAGYTSLQRTIDSDRLGLNPEDPETIDWMGIRVLRDEEERGENEGDRPIVWQYCVIFPLYVQGAPFDKHMDSLMTAHLIRSKLELFFRPCVIENDGGEYEYLHIDETFGQGDMIKRDFHEAVRWAVAALLAGPHMGLTLRADPSIDMDELFLKIRLEEGEKVDVYGGQTWLPNPLTKKYNTVQQLADAVNLRMNLEPTRYPSDHPCPTRDLDSARNFVGDDYIPAAISYSKERKRYYQKFTNLDHIRLIRLRMNQFLNWQHLMAEGVVKPGGFFAVHRWRAASMFSKRVAEVPPDEFEYPHGWSRFTSIAQWPGEQHLNHVKMYFGTETAFFFHWLTFFTSFLLVPAISGVLMEILRFFPFSSRWVAYLDIGFMAIMIMWSASFLEIYKRKMYFYVEAWGVKDYKMAQLSRASFQKGMIGSLEEECRRILHWCGILVVIFWTVGINYFINSQRANMLRHPNQIFYFGLRGATLEKFCKYLTTINIAVVDAIWGFVSPKLSYAENHRTALELKDAMVLKLIVEKVFVYYYPFWYIAFIQKHVEGCNIGGTTCEAYLEQSLLVFVALHIIWVMGSAGFSVLVTKRSMMQELGKAGARRQSLDEQYTYLEAQAKCPSYDTDVEIADFLELITSLGLVMQFSIILPWIPLLQMLSNLVELRIHAYKMVHIYRRVEARSAEGIGSWSQSIYAITWLALVINVALGVFFMEPMKSWAFEKQIYTFVVVEHVLILLKVMIEAFIPDVDVLTQMVSLTNNSVLDHIFSGDKGTRVLVKGPARVPNMSLVWDDDNFDQMSTISQRGLVHAVGLENTWLAAPQQRRSCAPPEDYQLCGLPRRRKADDQYQSPRPGQQISSAPSDRSVY